MERIPSPYPYRASKPGFILKGIIMLFSILSIALLIFAGSRDWKADKPVSAILTDTSDINGFVEGLRKTTSNPAKTSSSASLPAPESGEQASLISTGTFQHAHRGAAALPAGMSTAAAY